MHGRDAERMVERWLRLHGFTPERFPLQRRKLSKTPDFRVVGASGECFLVEVKTVRSNAPGHGSIAFKLARARAQFDGVNQGGRLANVLAFVCDAPAGLGSYVADLDVAATGIDLVLGLDAAGDIARILHRAAGSRHAGALTTLLASLERETT